LRFYNRPPSWLVTRWNSTTDWMNLHAHSLLYISPPCQRTATLGKTWVQTMNTYAKLTTAVSKRIQSLHGKEMCQPSTSMSLPPFERSEPPAWKTQATQIL
jgi:hypothetical protein